MKSDYIETGDFATKCQTCGNPCSLEGITIQCQEPLQFCGVACATEYRHALWEAWVSHKKAADAAMSRFVTFHHNSAFILR